MRPAGGEWGREAAVIKADRGRSACRRVFVVDVGVHGRRGLQCQEQPVARRDALEVRQPSLARPAPFVERGLDGVSLRMTAGLLAAARQGGHSARAAATSATSRAPRATPTARATGSTTAAATGHQRVRGSGRGGLSGLRQQVRQRRLELARGAVAFARARRDRRARRRGRSRRADRRARRVAACARRAAWARSMSSSVSPSTGNSPRDDAVEQHADAVDVRGRRVGGWCSNSSGAR